ncbi:hypothetical protein HZC30_01020 [Candidatus Woesearchaeota archaeon]|nr:hypothetical protein [Candidatus Woesearchaeota archaeon]
MLRPTARKMKFERVTLLVQDPPIESGGFCEISVVVKGKGYVAFLRKNDWEQFANHLWRAARSD